MSLEGRSLVSIDDLSNIEIDEIFELADRIRKQPREFFQKAAGRIAATLFYEPSTRTRLSFEASMQRLGGGVISMWDMEASSVSKGESLADTVRVIGGYSDVLVLRHPWEGAARLAAEYSPVPVVNAGDGGHEHPSQTLCDLYTLRDRYGSLAGLKVALCGDLERGRTIHSLAFALARFKANVVFVPGRGKDIPPHVLSRLQRDHDAHVTQVDPGVFVALFGHSPQSHTSDDINVLYITPTKPNQLILMPEVDIKLKDVRLGEGDLAIYVTRLQAERRTNGEQEGAEDYPMVDRARLKQAGFKDVSILHPLPRVDELSPEIDKDPRSLYFKQSAFGIPIRMALLWKILGLDCPDIVESPKADYRRSVRGPVYEDRHSLCRNPACVSRKDERFARPQFEIVREEAYLLRCLYCDVETRPEFAGNVTTKKYYPQAYLDRYRPPTSLEHVRFFATEDDAEAVGFTTQPTEPRIRGRRSPAGKQWLELVSTSAAVPHS